VDRHSHRHLRLGGVEEADDCSHNESLNCFGRFGNRPNESDH
jgi:hypothetical protein